MIFVYSIEEKVFIDKALPNEKDPTADDSSGVHLIISQRYVRFLIPVLPAGGKKIHFYNINSGEEIHENDWTPSMRTVADQSKSEIKGAWKLWMLLILLVGFFAFAIIYGNINKGIRDGKEALLEHRMETLQVDDILYLLFYYDDVWQATAAKVVQLKSDDAVLKFSTERFPVDNFDFDAAADKLSTSSDLFTSEEVDVVYAPLMEGRFVFKEPKSYNLVKVGNVEVKSIKRL